MIIVSQDKTNIVNFNNVNNIYIRDFKDFGNYYEISARQIYKDSINLGRYSSLDRAKEVLENIVVFYSLADKEGYVKPLEALALTKSREHSVIYMPEK